MLNPIVFTESVVRDFLRYQITTYPLADAGLYAQLRALLSLDETRQSPLLKGPYVSLSRPFRQGPSVADLCQEGVLHPHLANLVEHAHVYGHQEQAIRSIAGGHTTLISTGTGSGKTESFLYPIISRCLHHRDANDASGVVAVLVYPMNALAEDQLERLRALLVGTGIRFGMYVGKTPERSADVTGKRLQTPSRAAYDAAVQQRQQEREQRRSQGNYAIHPPEESCSREEMRAHPPRILLTNVKQLELILTRHRDAELFDGAQLEFIVFDEAHTFRGAQGAETACLIRRLRAFCGRNADETTCVAASATMVDPNGDISPGREFAARFFGVSAEGVVVVTEQYLEEEWDADRSLPDPLPLPAAEALSRVLTAFGDGEQGDVPSAVSAATGLTLPQEWEEPLYAQLTRNALLHAVVAHLTRPRPLAELRTELSAEPARDISEEEILLWLALGAAARNAGRPLVRPVLHVFVRGMGGAVVTFPSDQEGPRLWLTAEDSQPVLENGQPLYPLPVKSCTTCGQHYFSHELADFDFTADEPGGGELQGERTLWRPLPKKDGGTRVSLLDHLVTEEDDPEEPARTAPVFLCRHCGALHGDDATPCAACGRSTPLVRLLAVQQRTRTRHYLTSCLACGARGGERPGLYREPARPVRAVTVSDVHVLAQNMILHSHEDRLLVFADNRQDAAFQAGWMRDHSRRFRLRALMLERLNQGPITVGDLAAWLDQRLEGDRSLSESLLPEVWRVSTPAAEPTQHAEERRYFLRILVLREVATGLKQRLGLEPWGRMRVDYAGMEPGLPFFARWASVAGVTPEELHAGVASLLDTERRKMVVWDSRRQIFSRFQHHSDRDIQRGYLPELKGVPKGLKLFREPADNQARVNQWWSARGSTLARQSAQRWGVPADQVQAFLTELWTLLRNDLGILREVELRGSGPNGRVVRGTQGCCQLDGDRFLLVPHETQWECGTCRRLHNRPTPRMACMGWHCDGTIRPRQPDADNYDLAVVDQQIGNDTRMVKPREHSAQVPVDERERLERMFKDRSSHQVNTLVCTPTLELGVDIGALDSVLMRNVPPLPANYWQRAGRAGRRHRMAVNITYARPATHDRAFFAEPLRLLGGAVNPPRFNLRNPELVRKHAHATILTSLHQFARESGGLDNAARAEISETLRACFPEQVRNYLFDEAGLIRPAPLDVSPLQTLLATHQERLLAKLREAMARTWPAADAGLVSDEALSELTLAMAASLQEVIGRLWQRLQWAMRQKERLAETERQQGALNEEESATRRRCDRLIRRLKGEQRRQRNEAEGLDDTNTYAVLAAEGFLPGYGLDRGSVLGTAEMPRGLPGPSEYLLPRPKTLALREYVPGNLIYANGQKFVPRQYHLEATDPVAFHVNLANEAIVEAGQTAAEGTLGSLSLRAVPICDVDLPHQSHIHDEEDHRFQIGVVILGHELGRHAGGSAFAWGESELLFQKGVHLRLVNVGVALLVRSEEPRLGYPLCFVTGQTRSPLSSQTELENFQTHQRERYNRDVEDVGFYADVVADALTIQNLPGPEAAYSLAEALRIAGSQVLEMEVDDLQVLCVPQMNSTNVDVILYDPMPGGSGLLEQMIQRWEDLHTGATAFLQGCPSACETACIDCLLHFRNAHYHRHLDRHTALDQLRELGPTLEPTHSIPPRLPDSHNSNAGEPTNAAESRLRDMLLRAGFPEPVAQHSIPLGQPWGNTRPDFYYPCEQGSFDGVCVYLDGLSDHIHGNPETRERDRQIREAVRSLGYDVIEIPATALDDRDRMAGYFYRLARTLLNRDRAEEIRSADEWFAG
ncbi:MAG: DEAD/DEAH box helicase [Planctomycetes bacterium]|nr:DEAD/DEAH box helicase [Planctomycetota bacterium]